MGSFRLIYLKDNMHFFHRSFSIPISQLSREELLEEGGGNALVEVVGDTDGV